MSRPGVEIYSSAASPPTGVPTDTSVAFLVGEAQMGPTDKATRLTSMDEFTAKYGQRVSGVESYDWLDTYFHEGGATAYFLRYTDGAAVATIAATAIVAGNTVNGASAGAWANGYKLSVVPTPGQSVTFERTADDSEGSGKSKTASKAKAEDAEAPKRSALLTFAPEVQAQTPTFMASVADATGRAVQVSQPLETQGELATWLASGSYLTLTGPDSSVAVAAGEVTLAGGTDGTLPVSDSDASLLTAALALMPKELGPGQLSAAGRTDMESHAALLVSASDTRRVAILDCPANATVPDLVSAATAIRGAEQDRYGSMWAQWAVVPGIAPGTLRTVQWSAVEAALCARNDLAGNPNQAAAGSWGECQYVSDLATTFTEDECEALLYAGVDTARNVYGAVQAYAFRSLVDPSGPRSGWLQFNHCRLNMAIVAQAEAIGQDHVFAQIDGRGHELAAFGGQLGGMLIAYYNADILFGDDVTEAFVVNVGPAVNTPDTIEDGRIIAVLSVRMSPHAELVQIYIVKQPITVALV